MLKYHWYTHQRQNTHQRKCWTLADISSSGRRTWT